MTILLDTLAWVWSLFDDPRLSPSARNAIAEASWRAVSSVSLYEIGQKVGLGKWPAMEPHVAELERRIDGDGVRLAALTPGIALRAGLYEWPHRDPFDRLIVATAQVMALPLVSSDVRLDSVPGGLYRIW